jgi:hypothetical protein
MKYTFVIILTVLALSFQVVGADEEEKENEQNDIMNLLKSLESDKEIEKKFKEPDEKKKEPVKPQESPLEILTKASDKMNTVVKEMNKKDLNAKTIMSDQKDIVELLDELIKRAARSQSSGSSGSSGTSTPTVPLIQLPNQGKQGDNSTTGGGGDRSNDKHKKSAGTAGGRQWGNLPDSIREEIMQLLQEDIPLLYRDLLRLYYKNIDKE